MVSWHRIFFTCVVMLQMFFKFYILHTWHTVYVLECKITHELRIKWYRPSWSTDSICTIFRHLKSPQCYYADLSTNLVLWPSHTGRDISASRDIDLGVPSLHPSRNDLSINGLAKPTLYSSHFHQKFYLTM